MRAALCTVFCDIPFFRIPSRLTRVNPKEITIQVLYWLYTINTVRQFITNTVAARQLYVKYQQFRGIPGARAAQYSVFATRPLTASSRRSRLAQVAARRPGDGRPQCANSGHSQTVRRMGQIGPRLCKKSSKKCQRSHRRKFFAIFPLPIDLRPRKQTKTSSV